MINHQGQIEQGVFVLKLLSFFLRERKHVGEGLSNRGEADQGGSSYLKEALGFYKSASVPVS